MLIFKTISVDTDKKICYINDSEISLTRIEFDLLVFLINNKERIVTRQEIINSVWGEEVSKRAVDTTISRLRKKLGDSGKHIITRSGFGYGLN